MKVVQVLRVPLCNNWCRLLRIKHRRVEALGAPLRALLLEVACNSLEQGLLRRDTVPARADDVHEPARDEIGRRKRGPHVLIWCQKNRCYWDNAERGTYPPNTKCQTASSSISGQGREPVVRISMQQMANMYTSISCVSAWAA